MPWGDIPLSDPPKFFPIVGIDDVWELLDESYPRVFHTITLPQV